MFWVFVCVCVCVCVHVCVCVMSRGRTGDKEISVTFDFVPAQVVVVGLVPM